MLVRNQQLPFREVPVLDRRCLMSFKVRKTQFCRWSSEVNFRFGLFAGLGKGMMSPLLLLQPLIDGCPLLEVLPEILDRPLGPMEIQILLIVEVVREVEIIAG